MSTFLFMFYMLQDCGSTRTIRAYALYKWKEPTLSLRADPNLTYIRFRNCFGCRPLPLAAAVAYGIVAGR